MITAKTCKQCNKSFQGGPRAWYCPACRAERVRERDREQKLYGARRPLGSVDTCVICGKKYIVESGLQKYCPACKTEAVKAVDRKQGLEYYNANKDEINPVRMVKRRKPELIPCARCGKLIAHRGTPQKYCEDCLPEIKKEWQNGADKRRSPRERSEKE